MKLSLPTFDAHVHLRKDAMLRAVAPRTALQFDRAVVMPNDPVIAFPHDVGPYRESILAATRGTGFAPLMTMKMTVHTTPSMIRVARMMGVVALKIYPRGVTTGSHGHENPTIDTILAMGDVYEEMVKEGMVLCVHGELPPTAEPHVVPRFDREPACLDREARMLTTVNAIVLGFPRLKVVLEHVSDSRSVDYVRRAPSTVAATITVHHLYLALNDLVGCGEFGGGAKLHPDHFFAPMAKDYRDRDALQGAAFSGDPKFFLGTDSAPHPRGSKLAECGCAGLFSADVAVPALCHLFDTYGKMDCLAGFLGEYGPRFYGLDASQRRFEVEKASWEVPTLVCPEAGGLRPFLAGWTLPWRMTGDSK